MAELIDALDFESSFERSVGLKPTPVAKLDVRLSVRTLWVSRRKCRVNDLHIRLNTLPDKECVEISGLLMEDSAHQ